MVGQRRERALVQDRRDPPDRLGVGPIRGGAGRGRYLTTITSAGEEQFLVSTFLTGANMQAVFWIGGTDKTDGTTWTWVTGQPFTYTNWKDSRTKR